MIPASAPQEKERRKVQISGKSSCMVALPKRWVKEMGLRQGSEILVTRPSLTSLLISAEAANPRGAQRYEATIEFSDKENIDSLFRKVVSLYILGYDQVSIRGNGGFLSATKRDAIKELVRRHLIGTEGVADSKEKVTVHVLLGYSELSVENALKKIMLITTSMHREAMASLQSRDKSLAEGIVQREEEVGRFALYVIRQLNTSIAQGIFKESVMEPRDAIGYTLVTRSLERIASHAANTARCVVELKDWPPASVVPKLTGVGASVLVEDAMLSLFKRDHAGADAMVEKVKKFVASQNDLLRSVEEMEARDRHSLQVLIDSQKRMAEYARDIGEVVLDLTVERVISREEPIYA